MSEIVSIPAFLAYGNTCRTHISIKPFHQTFFGYPVVDIFYIGSNTGQNTHMKVNKWLHSKSYLNPIHTRFILDIKVAFFIYSIDRPFPYSFFNAFF